MHEFNSLFPQFLERCAELKSALMPVAYLLLVIGMVSSTITGRRSPGAYIRTFGRTIVYVLLLSFLVTWGNQLTDVVDTTVTQVIKADPGKVFDHYNAALTAKKATGEQAGWWDKLFHAGTTIFEAIVSGFLWVFGLFASLILFFAYIVQKMVLYLGYSLSPIFIGFLAIRSLSGIGSKYLLGLVGVMAWPLGWAVAAIVSDGLLIFMTDQSFLHDRSIGGAVNYGLQDFIGLALLGVWLIFSTIAAPVLIQRALASGFQIGSTLLSGAFSAGMSGVGAGVTTMGTMASSSGALTGRDAKPDSEERSSSSGGAESPKRSGGTFPPGLAIAGAGIAAALTATAASSLNGGSGGTLIGSLAHMLPRKRFADDDVTGGKAARELIKNTRQPSS